MARLKKDYVGARRTAALKVQLTPAERQEIDARAAATGRSLSDFTRLVLLSDAKKPAPSARDPQAIRALAVEISRVGNNINQLAHVANEVRDLPLLHEFRVVSAHLIATLDKVMEL